MNDLIVVAMREEAPTLVAKYWNVFCVGVGKVNSAVNTAMLIEKYRPKRVINVGTAGGLTLNTGLYRVNKVFQHDVNLMALGLLPGEHLNDHNRIITFEGDGYTCASGDLFVTEPHKLRIPCDIVEMEAYSIAKACHNAGISCEIYKYISDKADENADVTWKEQVSAGEQLYYNILDSLNVKLEEY
jgi:adenosylhomocysteine nucleosidase